LNAISTFTEDKLVALACIAAELHSVMGVAWGVSLAAKNAKIISVQAGDKGRGFQPITEFIDEISQQAMKGVDEINSAAIHLSKISVYGQRSVNAYNRFASVKEKNRDAKHISSLTPAMKRVEKTMLGSAKEFKHSLRHLYQLLESMDECMLSARSIASVSRIVTSDSGEFRDKLKVVADELDNAATYIKEKLSDSYEHLSNINVTNRKQVYSL